MSSETITGKGPNDFTIIINNKKIIVESAAFIKTMDTGADACTVVIPWTPGLDADTDTNTAPYSYSNAGVYIGNDLQSEMVLYDVTQSTRNRTEKTLEFFSKTADIIDSTVIAPYEMNNIRLTDRCKQQCKPYGISVIVGQDAAETLNVTHKEIRTIGYKRVAQISGHYDPAAGATGNYNLVNVPVKKSVYVTDEFKFPRIKAEPVDTVFYHLSKLASQRGLLLSNTKYGDLLITKGNPNAASIGTIYEGKTALPDEYVAHFKGRDRFNTYRALVRTPHHHKTAYIQTVQDMTVKSPRLLTFHADDNIAGSVKNSAVWRKNKSAADAMTLSFPVNSWYGPDEKLWQVNTAVTVISDTLSTKKGFTYLITRVEFKYSNRGNTAVLQLKPPSVYSTDSELVEPWQT